MYIYIYTLYVHTYIHTYIHIIYIYIYTNVHIVCTYIYIHIYIYIYMYWCTNILYTHANRIAYTFGRRPGPATIPWSTQEGCRKSWKMSKS